MSLLEPAVRSGGAACCIADSCAPISTDAAADLAVLLKALADPVRLRLLSVITAHEGAEACVCDLTAPLGPRSRRCPTT